MVFDQEIFNKDFINSSSGQQLFLTLKENDHKIDYDQFNVFSSDEQIATIKIDNEFEDDQKIIINCLQKGSVKIIINHPDFETKEFILNIEEKIKLNSSVINASTKYRFHSVKIVNYRDFESISIINEENNFNDNVIVQWDQFLKEIIIDLNDYNVQETLKYTILGTQKNNVYTCLLTLKIVK